MTKLRSSLLPALRLARYLSLAVVCSVGACADDNASDGAGLEEDVATIVGAKGGTVIAKGVTLVIPEGALTKDVEITVKNKGYAAPSHLKVKQASDVFEFGPEGQVFTKQVDVKFHADKDDEKAAVYFTKSGAPDEFEKIDSQKMPNADGKGVDMVAKTTHFSQGFVGVPLDGQDLDGGVLPDGFVPGGEDDGGAPDGDADGGEDGDASIAPTPKHVTVHSKDTFGNAVNQTWAAFQDGDGAWQLLVPSATTGTYEFDVLSQRYAVAFVCANGTSTHSWNTLHYEPAVHEALEVTTAGSPCIVGTFPTQWTYASNAITNGNDYVRLGSPLTHRNDLSNDGSTNIPFSTLIEDNVVTDLMFGSSVDIGTGLESVLFRRDMTLTGPLTDVPANHPQIDKAGVRVGKAFAVALNASAGAILRVLYTTRGASEGMDMAQEFVSGTSARILPFATVPEGTGTAPERDRRPTDRYVFTAFDAVNNVQRSATLSNYASGDMAMTMPDTFVVSFDAEETSTWRPVFAFENRPEATEYQFLFEVGDMRDQGHEYAVHMDPAWLGAAENHAFTFPDLSLVTGFGAGWLPAAPLGTTRVHFEALVVHESDSGAGRLSTMSKVYGGLNEGK